MPLQIETTPTDRGTRVRISGVIDEDADLSAIRRLDGRVELVLGGIRRVNSFGARSWMDAIRELAARAQLVFVECSPAVIDQLNMIQGFLGHGRVASFYAPMVCEHCDHETLHLFSVSECRANDDALPEVTCDECSRLMELDDLEDQYTLFLREPTVVR